MNPPNYKLQAPRSSEQHCGTFLILAGLMYARRSPGTEPVHVTAPSILLERYSKDYATADELCTCQVWFLVLGCTIHCDSWQKTSCDLFHTVVRPDNLNQISEPGVTIN
jgi:hypothetical protein